MPRSWGKVIGGVPQEIGTDCRSFWVRPWLKVGCCANDCSCSLVVVLFSARQYLNNLILLRVIINYTLVFGCVCEICKKKRLLASNVCTSVITQQLAFHWKYCHEYLSTFRKYGQKSKISLKFDKNNMCFTWRPMYIFYHISLSSYWNEKCFRRKLYRKSKDTFNI
jgi:hypothetical protein